MVTTKKPKKVQCDHQWSRPEFKPGAVRRNSLEPWRVFSYPLVDITCTWCNKKDDRIATREEIEVEHARLFCGRCGEAFVDHDGIDPGYDPTCCDELEARTCIKLLADKLRRLEERLNGASITFT